MSGYLEVKFPFKNNRRLNPWKTWKRQWCILRPCPVWDNSALIAFHSTLGLSINSTVQIPPKSIICRKVSRSQQYSFGVFAIEDLEKSIVLLSGQSETESQMWIYKIRAVLNGKKYFGKGLSPKQCYISLIDNDFSRSCGLIDVHGTFVVDNDGLRIKDFYTCDTKASFLWKDFIGIELRQCENHTDNSRICTLEMGSEFQGGVGLIDLFSLDAKKLVKMIEKVRRDQGIGIFKSNLTSTRRISRSESCISQAIDLAHSKVDNRDSGLSSCCGESIQAGIDKWASLLPDSGFSDFPPPANKLLRSVNLKTGVLLGNTGSAEVFHPANVDDFNGTNAHYPNMLDCPSDRRCSGISIASGIYEEISEEPPKIKQNKNLSIVDECDDGTYECVADVYATMRRPHRRGPPPPLPPRSIRKNGRSDSTSDSGLEEDSWLSTPFQDANNMVAIGDRWPNSVGSLPRWFTSPQSHRTHDSEDKNSAKLEKLKPPFNVFRKRIKSDSKINIKPSPSKDFVVDCAKADERKSSTIPRKKRFDFSVTPAKSMDIIRNFRVGRVIMRNFKTSPKNIGKGGVAKSCEYLDSRQTTCERKSPSNRCSKSFESLDDPISCYSLTDAKVEYAFSSTSFVDDGLMLDENEGKDLSMIYAEKKIADLSIPQDIVELILKGKEDLAEIRMRQRRVEENHYIPMSPIGHISTAATSEEQQYMVMKSPIVHNTEALLATKAV